MRLSVWMLPVAVIVGLQTASADVFSIDKDNSSGAFCSVASPCGTVTVTGTSTLLVVISMDSPFGVFSNNDTFGFNVVGPTTGVTLSNFSNSNFDGSGGSGNEDGWGNFEFRVSGPGGSGAVSTLSFDVSRPSDPFTGPSDIELGATNGGNGPTVFGLHVRNDATGATGFAGVDDPAPVPEPGSVILLLSVIAFVTVRWKKRASA
jgi:hypothetical protein